MKLTVLAAALGTAIAGGGMVLGAPEAIAQATKLVFEERNENATVTKAFETQGLFEVRWTATGGKFLVKIVDGAGDEEIVSSAPQSREEDQAPMTGKISHTGPGSFKLAVEAAGPWYIRVVEFE